MTCYLCLSEKISGIHGSGNCVECNGNVCTDPSGRADDHFHGEFCMCDCGSLVCEKHMRRHTNQHGCEPSDCFPGLVGPIATASLEGAAAMLARRADPRAPSNYVAILRFLNFVTPGHEALRAMTSDMDAELWRIVDYGFPGDEPMVFLSMDLIQTRRVCESVLVLSARELGIALSRAEEEKIDPERRQRWRLDTLTLDVPLAPFLRALMQWTRGIRDERIPGRVFRSLALASPPGTHDEQSALLRRSLGLRSREPARGEMARPQE
jgi:hypothetical protein